MPETGDIIGGSYSIVRLLGKGGMGEVYEAEQAELHRKVAVKILSKYHADDEDVLRRFRLEAQAAGRIGHESICEVTDFGETDAGVPFLVMPLLKGNPLDETIRREAPLDPTRAADIAVQVLDGLEAAHAAGIIHRDLKPENLFLTKVGSRGIELVKILDFGISKFLGQVIVDDTRKVTQTGAIIGTPSYMAPEQARGSSETDHRVDVYAVGAILYEMLTGRRAHDGNNFNEILLKVVLDPIPSLPTDLPAPLVAIVERAMHKDPDARYQSAAELRQALLEAVPEVRSSGPADLGSARTLAQSTPEPRDATQTTTARSNVELDSPTPPARSRRTLVLLGAGTLVIVVALLLVVSFKDRFTGSAPQQPEPSETETVEESTEESKPPVYVERRITALPEEKVLQGGCMFPDGRAVVYSDGENVWLQSLTGHEVKRVPINEGESRVSITVAKCHADGRSVFIQQSVDGETLPGLLDTKTGRINPVSGLGAGDQFLDANEEGNLIVVSRVTPGASCRVDLVRLQGGEAERSTIDSLWDCTGFVVLNPSSTHIAYTGWYGTEADQLTITSLDGSYRHVVVSDYRLALSGARFYVAWPEDHRFIYGLASSANEPPGSTLWEQALDDRFQPVGDPRKLMSWTGAAVTHAGYSSETGALAIAKLEVSKDVHTGALIDTADGLTLGEPARLTMDDREDRPSGWTPDGKVLFVSNRLGDWDVHAQSPSDVEPAVVAGGPGWQTWPTWAPEHGILYWDMRVGADGATGGEATLMLAPEGGESPRPVVTVPIEAKASHTLRPPPFNAGVDCATKTADRCVISQTHDEMTDFSWLDLETGEIGAPFHTEKGKFLYNWAINSTGSEIWLVSVFATDVLRVFDIEKRSLREIATGGMLLGYIDPHPDGRHILMAGLAPDFKIPMLGIYDLEDKELVPQLQALSTFYGQPTISVDGSQLAFLNVPQTTNIWLLEPQEPGADAQ